MKADQLGQNFDDTSGTNRSGHVDCQTFTRVLIDHRQTLLLLAVGTRVEYEIVRPDVSCRRRRLRPRAMDRHASTGSLARHLQPGKTPQPPGSVNAHGMPLPLQKDLNATVTITRILRRKDTFEVVAKLARAAGVSLDWVATGEGDGVRGGGQAQPGAVRGQPCVDTL